MSVFYTAPRYHWAVAESMVGLPVKYEQLRELDPQRLKAVVVVPENNNPAKNRIIRETGAELIEAGRTFEEASRVVESLCKERISIMYMLPMSPI